MKVLFEKATTLSEGLFFPKSLGMVPENLLVKTENPSKLVRLEIVSGNCPDNWFVLTSKVFSDARFAISGGIVPTNPL